MARATRKAECLRVAFSQRREVQDKIQSEKGEGKMSFNVRVISGKYHDLKTGTAYRKGEIFATEVDLVKRWPSRFALVGVQVTNVAPAQDAADETAEVVRTDGETAVGPAFADLKECSDEFANSGEKTGLLVARNYQQYYVYDTDDLALPLNTKALKKADVQAFVNSQIEG